MHQFFKNLAPYQDAYEYGDNEKELYWWDRKVKVFSI